MLQRLINFVFFAFGHTLKVIFTLYLFLSISLFNPVFSEEIAKKNKVKKEKVKKKKKKQKENATDDKRKEFYERVTYEKIMKLDSSFDLKKKKSEKVPKIPAKYQDINKKNIKIKKIYNTEDKEVLQENSFRRFEVVFFISLPFTGLLSFLILQGANNAIYEDGRRKLPIAQIFFIGINSVLLSTFIAYRDMKAWEIYKEKHLKDLQFRELESQGGKIFLEKFSSISELNYYFELPKYYF